MIDSPEVHRWSIRHLPGRFRCASLAAPGLLIFNTAPASRRCFAHQKSAILSTKRPIALSHTNHGHNDDGGLRKASGCGPKALYGMPGVQRDLMLGRTPTSSRLQAFRTPSLKGLTSRGRFWRHPSGGKRFIVRADEKLSAFLELPLETGYAVNAGR